MSKRETKAQREARQHRELWEKVYAVVCGACGRAFDEAYGTDSSEWLSAEELSRAVPALRDLFEGDEECPLFRYCFQLHNLNHFESPHTITEFLWEQGVRA